MTDDVAKGHCPNCGADRNASVAGYHKEDEDDGNVWGSSEYRILKCLGCGRVYYQTYSLCSELYDISTDGDYVLEPRIEHWPSPRKRTPPNWPYGPVPDEIESLWYEAHSAYEANLYRLAAMGLRSVLERIIVDRIGDQGKFVKGLD